LVGAIGGYNAWQVDAAVAKVPLLRMEIVKRSDDMKGFVVLPRRWVVERTFSWFGRNRRLAKDFENLAETLATFVTLASIQLALRRLARAQAMMMKVRKTRDSRPSPTPGPTAGLRREPTVGNGRRSFRVRPVPAIGWQDRNHRMGVDSRC
jgi:Transposase DDE domain